MDENVVQGPNLHLRVTREHDLVELQDTTCAICLEQFVRGAEMAATYCGHVYHVRCIQGWLRAVSLGEYELPSLQASR